MKRLPPRGSLFRFHQMPDLTESIRTAWRQAAQDLGFRYTERFAWVTPDSRRMEYLGLVHGFGRSRGTLVRVMQLGEFPGSSPLDEDYLVAKLGGRFAAYDRDLWMRTLTDWGWHPEANPRERPSWVALEPVSPVSHRP
jgi:hypothetical protein